MSERKKNRSEPVDGNLYRTCAAGHDHLVGRIEGILHHADEAEESGEVIYEDKNGSFVGGGNPRYSANYDQMDWN